MELSTKIRADYREADDMFRPFTPRVTVGEGAGDWGTAIMSDFETIEHTDDGKWTIEFLPPKARILDGKVRFVRKFENWVDSEVVENPTMGDLMLAFSRSMAATKDLHHVFMEGFSVTGIEDTRDGAQIVEIHTGS